MRDLDDLDLEMLLLAAEHDRAPQHLLGTRRSVKIHRLGPALKREGAQQAGDPEHVIRVHVGEEDVGQREGDPVAHHLPLGAFAAIEHQRLALADNGER